MSVDPGEGWRLLKVGELVEAGDEYRDNMAWKPVPSRGFGKEILGGFYGHLPHRRRVPAATADAPTPLAWGVQIESGRGLWGHYDYEHEARAVCEAVNREEGSNMTVVPLCTAPLSPPSHHRITAERDAAIRERDEAMERVRRLESEREDALLHLPACCGSIGHAAATLEAERDEARAECERLRGQLKTLEPIAKAHEAAIKAAEQFNAEQAAKAMTDPASVYRFADAMANGMHAGTAAVMRPIMHALVDQRDAYKARVAELEAAGEAGTVVRKPLIAACWNPHSGLCDIGSGMGDMRYVRVSLTPAQVADIERQVSGEASSK